MASQESNSTDVPSEAEAIIGYCESLLMPDPIGYLVVTGERDGDIEVPRTDRNLYMFYYHQTRRRFEVARQSQGVVADTLLYAGVGPDSTRPLAFFDRDGNFHDNATLEYADTSEAFFSFNNGTDGLTIAIGGICCLSVAYDPALDLNLQGE